MQCYTELVPPSGVTHSVSSSFTGPKTSNLIVARSSVLQLFNLKQIEHSQETKLILLAESQLSGIVTAMGTVKLLHTKSGGDALLVAFRDAKLCLIEWDPAQHSISTISIHYYENHDLLLCPWVPDLKNCPSRLSIDPSSRCAAFHFGINNLAVIPFYQSADDLILDDFDDIASDDGSKPAPTPAALKNGDTSGVEKPYAPSFILPLTLLDPTLVHPIDMAFLHEYRQPTIGILYSVLAPSNNMASERRDVLIYAVYSLEIEQRASTTLSSITKLPNDLFKIIALPLPIGGSLLIGGNELIHIDQGGKANGLAVNEFAKESSSFSMSDQSELRMRLEGCQVEPIGNASGDMLLILSTGELTTLIFRRDGRSVSGLSLQRHETASSPNLVLSRSSGMTNLGQGQIFIASEESDSLLLGQVRQNVALKRQTSRPEENGHDLDDDDIDEDDDDLYNGANGGTVNGHDANFAKNLQLFDTLTSIGPINDTAFGRPVKRKREDDDSDSDDTSLELAMACGHGRAGALAFASREISPQINSRKRVQKAVGVWSMSTKPPTRAARRQNYHDTVILSVASEDGPGRSLLMSLSDGEMTPREGTDFDEDTMTMAVGRLPHSGHTIQVSANDIRVYDSDFGLSQIFPIVDEDSGETAQVVSAMCIEPYVCFVKNDHTLSLLKADESGELDEIDLPANVPANDVVSACLYCDTDDFFGSSRYNTSTDAQVPVILAVLTKSGSFGIYPIANLKIRIFDYQGIDFLPIILAPNSPLPKHWKNPDELSEILIADIGDVICKTVHLVVRNSSGDVCLYLPYPVQGVEGSYKFIKVAHHNADVSETLDEESLVQDSKQHLTQRLHVLPNIDGFSTVLVAGQSPSIIFKSASSRPRFQRLRFNEVKFASYAHDSICANGFMTIDASSTVNFCSLPQDTIFTHGDYVIRKISLDEDITGVSYHPTSTSYVLTTHTPTIFQLPQDDEWHPEWTEETTKFLPTTTVSHIKLLSSSSNNIISTFSFDPSERVLTTRCLRLEISEETHEFADVIVVGTAITKGENVVTRGNIYIFTVASVNPRPGVPESDKKLKLITKEDCRGSVSAITAIGSQGYFLAAQGQKCMVRGLKEDKSVLPVAFLDMRYHTHVARNLPGTGLTILGDAFSGLWLMGYSEEPYKMQLLSRDFEDPECIAADFLPDGKQLFIVSADSNGDLRFLEYDPENPKTERGAKLLLRSTFNTGTYQTSITLIPRTPTPGEILASFTAAQLRSRTNGGIEHNDDDISDSDSSMTSSAPAPTLTSIPHAHHNLLLTSQTGSLSLITPLSTQSYRRLSTLQNILLAQLEQPCGLNPRAFRAVETDGVGGRGVIDGDVVRRWNLLSSWHKASLADKVGAEVWEVRRDIEAVSGAGLGYL